MNSSRAFRLPVNSIVINHKESYQRTVINRLLIVCKVKNFIYTEVFETPKKMFMQVLKSLR